MNNKSKTLVLLLSLFIAGSLLAGGQQEEPLPEAVEVPAPGEEVYETTKELLNYELLDFNGNDYGNINDLVVDTGTGYLAYVVLEVTQDQGAGMRLVPVPYPYLIPNAERQSLRIGFEDLSLIDDALGYAPGTDFVDQYSDEFGFLRNIRFYWSSATRLPESLMDRMVETRPDTGGTGYGAGVRVFPDTLGSLRSMLDSRVVGLHGGTAGRIEELAWELVSGGLSSVFFYNAKDGEIYPMPPGVFVYDTRENDFSLDVEHLPFQGARAVDAGNITAAIRSGNFHNRFHNYWIDEQPAIAFRTGIRVLPGVRMTATQVQDFYVRGFRGTRIGTVTDAVIERDGSVPFILMVPEAGIVARADYWYPLPAEALSIDRFQLQNEVLLDISNDELEGLPKFDRGELPSTTNPDWDEIVMEYWEEILTPPQNMLLRREGIARERTGTPLSVLVSDFLNFDVQDDTGNLLGTVEDLMINLDHTVVDYLVISFEEALDDDEYLYPIPFEALSLTDSFDGIVIDTTTTQLLAAPRYMDEDRLLVDPGEWSDMAQEYWLVQ